MASYLYISAFKNSIEKQNPDQYDDAIEQLQSLVSDKDSELEEAETALAEAEANRSKNKCWAAQTGKNYELDLVNVTNKKHNKQQTKWWESGVQKSSSDFNPPVYLSLIHI